ncbi:MAG: helix-turn-helix domain-containing protein [Thermomicrobiales bacterium]
MAKKRRDPDQHNILPQSVPDRREADTLLTVEFQREFDLFAGHVTERLFVKLYLAARTSGLLASVSDRDWKTLCTLATYMDGEGYCYPSQAELARAMGCSRQMANERVKSLAEFRFQGQPVLLVVKGNRRESGKWARNGYRVLPVSNLRIYDHAPVDQTGQNGPPEREIHDASTVSSFLDTARENTPTVSSQTVTVPLDTNKNQSSKQENTFEIRRTSHEKENETTEQPVPVFRHTGPEQFETSSTNSARQRSGEPAKTVPLGEAIADWQRRRQVQPMLPPPQPTSGASDQVDARAPRRRGRRAKPVYDEDREVLLAFITDFAREFNDQAPLSSSVTRAYNLLKRSALDRNGFLDRMYQARALTKERTGSIRSRAGENDFGLPVKAQMAFFFAVLEDLVGLRDDEASPPASQ